MTTSDNQALFNYAVATSYEDLAQQMLEGTATNDCNVKHEAHMALCIKYANDNGCNREDILNCYDDIRKNDEP